MNEAWVQIITLFLANAGLILWFRSESRSDHRQCIDLIIAIQNDMKDFHARLALQDQEFKNRLCRIEEVRNAK
jgi:hypothetical protein